MNFNYGSIEDSVLRNQTQRKSQRISKYSVDRICSSFLLLPIVFLVIIAFNAVWKLNDQSVTPSQEEIADTSANANLLSEELFDYIVVGAGPAGIITAVSLARRLEEESQKTKNNYEPKVLLLESGTMSQSSVLRELQKLSHRKKESNRSRNTFPLNKFDIPFLWNELSQENEVQYGVNNSTSTPFKKSYELHHWPITQTFLGRAVGGSGIHNAMINVRALPSDFDRWNISRWNSSIMMPYFDLMESYDSDFMPKGDKLHRGTNGPLKIVNAGSGKMPVSPVAKEFIASSLAAGLQLASSGFNAVEDDKRLGVGYYEFTIRNGVRDSVAAALLGNVENGWSIPKSLVVKTDSTVQNIEFDLSPSKPRAVGVNYVTSKSKGVLRARLKEHDRHTKRPHEVILAAGAIMTPQILSNSGISDGGIIMDLKAVGKNLQDHPVVAIAFEDSEGLKKAVSDYLHDAQVVEDNSVKTKDIMGHSKNFYHNGKGLEGVLGTPGFSVGAFLASPWADEAVPDIQLTVFPRIIEPHYMYQIMNNGKPDNMKMLITVALLRPEGKHRIKLAPFNQTTKSDDFEKFLYQSLPTILPEQGDIYLSDSDAKKLEWGITQVRTIKNSGPLANSTGNECFPGSHIKGNDLQDFIKRTVMTNSHWCGSTRMGTDPNNSVVDEFLRVHGVDRLRIVDTGIMPYIPNGNTHSTACAAALRAADLILDDL